MLVRSSPQGKEGPTDYSKNGLVFPMAEAEVLLETTPVGGRF